MTCDTCLRNALWRIRPNCSCSLRQLGGKDRLWYYACTQHIGQVTRLFTESHGWRHTGVRAPEVILSEVPERVTGG